MDNEEIKDVSVKVKVSEVVQNTLRHWPWILLSVIVCVGVAFIYVQRSKPVYTRTAKIVINDESNGGSINSQLSTFADMGLVSTSTNQIDEIIKLKSMDVIREVISRLKLDMSYEIPKMIGSTVAYGPTLPIIVSLPSISEDDAASMRVSVSSEGIVTLSDMKWEKDRLPSPAPFRLGQTVKTEIGPLTVSATPFYKPGEDYTVIVRHIPMISAIQAYSSKFNIHLEDKHGNTVEIIALDNSTDRAEDIINTLIDVYNERSIEKRNEVSVATNKFINDRLISLERELGGVDKDIANYQSEHLLPDVKQAASIYMLDNQTADKQLLDLNNQLQVTRYMRQYLGNASGRNEVLPSNSGIDNVAIERQITEYNEKLLERNRYVSNSSENHPMIKTLDSELASMRAAIVDAMDNEIAGLTAQLRNVQARKGMAQSQIASTPTRANYLLGVERQQKVKESLYLYLLQKREENELSKAYTANNTEVILKPFGTDKPVAPRKKIILAGAFLLGLFIPFGINYLKELLNTRIRGKKDIEGLTIPLIGEIPDFRASHKKSLFRRNKQDGDPIVVEPGNRNIINDAFRVLRANVKFINEQRKAIADSDEKGVVTMITSFNPGSGKSFISTNLAVAFALRDQKVIVVDGDMRHASTSEIIGSPSKGLSDYLSNRITDWRSLVVSDPKMHGADVLPVGKFPPNPTELLEGPNFGHLVKELGKVYDYVLIDCPPVTAMADSKLIESAVDNCVFVIRVGNFERASLPELESYYTKKMYKNMTLILNGTGTTASSYKSVYSDGYHYGVEAKGRK